MSSHTKILLFTILDMWHYIGYVAIKKDLKIYTVNPLYLILGEVNGYFEEINGNMYLTLVPTNESKGKIKKKYEELQIKLRDLIRPINKSLDDYDEQYMKINFD